MHFPWKELSMTITTGGLEDIVATNSYICDLDGKLGKLTYFGVDIHDLARYSTFEETAFLLWHGVLPTRAQLEEVKGQMQSHRELPSQLIELMHLLPTTTSSMDVLRTAVSALSAFDPNPNDRSPDVNYDRAVRLTAMMTTIVVSWEHIRNGRKPVAPLPDESHATNFLYMLKGQKPDAQMARDLDVCFILHADHELNASTFAARVTAGGVTRTFCGNYTDCWAVFWSMYGAAQEQG